MSSIRRKLSSMNHSTSFEEDSGVKNESVIKNKQKAIRKISTFFKHRPTLSELERKNIVKDEDAKVKNEQKKTMLESFFARRPDQINLKRRGTWKEAVFGISLPEVAQKGITVQQDCIDFLQKKGMDKEGLFRIPGGIKEVDSFVQSYEDGKTPDFNDSVSPHTVASLLKKFFRDLPEPVIPQDDHDKCIEIVDLKDNSKKIEEFTQLISKMNEPYQSTLKKVLEFLYRVQLHSEYNKMNCTNLGIVFGPVLMRVGAHGDHFTLMEMQRKLCVVVEYLIENANFILGIDFQDELDRITKPDTLKTKPVVEENQAEGKAIVVNEEQEMKVNSGTEKNSDESKEPQKIEEHEEKTKEEKLDETQQEKEEENQMKEKPEEEKLDEIQQEKEDQISVESKTEEQTVSPTE